MSTPSFIGVLCKEGIIKFVYCHSDGYPSYLGKMLLEHYNTPELATALVDLGSLSMVRERLAPDDGETHGFDTPVRHGTKGGITTAYHRDRGDDLEIDSVPSALMPTPLRMPSRKYRRHLTPTMLGLPCSLAKTCRVLCAMAAIR